MGFFHTFLQKHFQGIFGNDGYGQENLDTNSFIFKGVICNEEIRYTGEETEFKKGLGEPYLREFVIGNKETSQFVRLVVNYSSRDSFKIGDYLKVELENMLKTPPELIQRYNGKILSQK